MRGSLLLQRASPQASRDFGLDMLPVG